MYVLEWISQPEEVFIHEPIQKINFMSLGEYLIPLGVVFGIVLV